ncbi:MAG: hypothetical protein JST92_03310 [Deltaproteobacteria bacterium]|nr:hypothetical protein [Deltaproteobacteria bacterium]
MSETPTPPPEPPAEPKPPEAKPEPSDVVLTRFFESSPAAKTAAGSLGSKAEVGVRFTDVPGDFRFFADSKKPRLVPGKASDPDFELEIAPGAVKNIAGQPNADVGDLGILFFQAMVAGDAANKIRVKLHSGLFKLTTRGWLSVLASGGPKVIGWMAQKGLKGPGAVASALSKLKK